MNPFVIAAWCGVAAAFCLALAAGPSLPIPLWSVVLSCGGAYVLGCEAARWNARRGMGEGRDG